MEGLQNAEFALEKLQHELDEARKAQQNVVSEKQNLEKRLQETAAAADSSTLHASHSEVEVSQLKAEIEVCLIFTIVSQVLSFVYFVFHFISC